MGISAVPEGKEAEERDACKDGGVGDLLEDSEGREGEGEGDEYDEDQGVHSYLDHFREADTFFLLLNKLIQITGDLCSGVYTPELQGKDEEVFLSHLSDHYISKKKSTFSKVTNEATTLMKKCVKIIETYQNLPTLLDKHLTLMVEPVTDLLSVHLKSIAPLTNLTSPCPSSSDPSFPLSFTKTQTRREDVERYSHHTSLPLSNHVTKSDTSCSFSSTDDTDASFPSSDSLKASISACRELASCVSLRLLLHFLYALCKVRGYKVVRPLFSQRPELLEILMDLSISLYQKEIGDSIRHSAHQEGNSTLPLSSSTNSHTTGHSHPRMIDHPYTPGSQASMISEKHSSEEERMKKLRKDLLGVIDKDYEELKKTALQLPLWSSHYTLLIWISLAVLAPFKLAILDSSLSSSSSRQTNSTSLHQERKTDSTRYDVHLQKEEKKSSTQSDSLKAYETSLEEGSLSMKILSLTEAYIRYSSTNASDAACVVLARFFSRSDVVSRKNHKLFSQFLLFCRQILHPSGGARQEISSTSSGGGWNEKDRLGENEDHKEIGKGADSIQKSQHPLLLPSSFQQDTLIPLFAQANALRALNEILKFIERDAVLPELPQIFCVLGLGSSSVHTPGETTTAATTTPARWGVIAENSSLFRKLRCSCAARLSTLLLPPMDHRSLRWRYTPNARCLVSLLLQNQDPSSSQAREVGEQRGVFSSDQKPSSSTSFHNQTNEEEEEDEEEVPEEVEDVLDLLLNGISDKDSTVRWACAKGVARVVLRLPKDFADQVVANILDSLDSTPLSSSLSSKRLWHGHMLALAELLRRGLVSLSRLSSCCALLRLALSFHTEDGIGGQGGGEDQAETALRDAACYAVWSIARSYYDTFELEKELLPLSHSLLLVSLFDRDVNCRRAAAAAFQELEGRQGGIPEGLRIITHADFFALATRRSSYLHVAPKIAGLSVSYAQLLLKTLSSLLLSGILDQDLRILAAASLKKITAMYRELCVKELLPSFVKKLSLPDQPLSIRHGTLLGVTAIIEGISSSIGIWRRSHLGKDERKTEVESCLSSSQQSCSKEASAHNLHTSPPTPTTAAPAEKDGEEVREAKDRSVSSTTSSSSSCEDEEEEERKRRFLREWLLPESVQGDIRQIVIKVEKRREYRGKGGDLIRIGVCKLIQALASSPLIVFKSATSKRYLATLMDGLKHFSEEVQLSSAEALRPLLFLRMDTTDILESFLPGLLANLKKPDEHIAARRGYVLALATLPPSVYRHCYRLATLRKKKEKEKSARMESNTMNISEEGMQRRKDEAMKDKNQECTMKIEDEKTPLSCSSRLSRGVKEDSTSTRTSQKVPKEEEKRQHEASGEDGGFLFDILRYEATSKMPLNDPGLNDAHTRRNALIAYGFALRAILSLSPSSFSSFTQDNPCSTPENPEDKEEKGEGEQAFRFSKSFWDEIVETLTVCCSDCQSDRRGDVGSWIREVAVEVICFLLENVNVDAPHASTLPLPSHHAHPQREQQEGEQQNNKERNRNDQMTCSSHAKEERSAVPPLSIASECEPSISVWEKLLGLVIRMALENLGRTRSRATFLLYRMTAPLPSTSRRYSPSAERKGEIYQEEGDRREDNQEAGKDSSDGRCPRPEYLASLSPPPFRIEWIWGRVFHDYSYELGPADIPPISVDTLHAEATHNTSTGENPCCSGSSPNIRRCLISHLRPEPRGLRFIQESLLPIAEKQRKAAEETKPVLPFHDLHLSDFSQPITLPLMPPSLLPSAQNHTGDHEPSSSSFSGAPIDGLSSSLKGCTTSSVLSRAEMTGEKDRKKEGVSDKEKEKLKKRDEDEECWMSSFDFLLDLSVIDGGYASLHKTRKSGVVLRLPFFTNPSITYPRLLIFLLFPVYRRRAAEGTCLGVGGALGSSADQTLRAVLSFFTHLRELLRDRSNDQVGQKRGLISEREDFLLENKQKKEEVQKRLFFSLPLNKQSDKTDDISALYLDVLHAIHKLGEKFEEKEKPEEHESSSLKLSRTSTSGILSMVSGSLIDVLLSCRDQKKKIRNKEEDKLPPVDESDFFDKLRTSALKTSIILASNDILTYRDATRMLSVLMDASLTSGPVGRSFQFIRDQCEAFIVLASSRSVDEGEGNEERGEGFVIGNTNEVLSIQKIALCKALQFLKHRFPKIRQFAAETLYSSLVLSLSSLAPCPDAQSTLLPARPTSQEKGFSSSGGALPCVTTGEQRQSSKLPESEESPFRLNEQQIDEVTDILTLTPWLEMQSDSKSHPVPGDDAHTSKSTETNPVERLIALFGIEKEWQAIQSKKPRK